LRANQERAEQNPALKRSNDEPFQQETEKAGAELSICITYYKIEVLSASYGQLLRNLFHNTP
jgi:hypothetical protein